MFRPANGKDDRERRANPFLGGNLYPAAVVHCDVANNGETEAGSAGLRSPTAIDPIEAFEYPVEIALGDADARVLDNDGNFGACLLYTSPSPRDLSTSRMPSSA